MANSATRIVLEGEPLAFAMREELRDLILKRGKSFSIAPRTFTTEWANLRAWLSQLLGRDADRGDLHRVLSDIFFAREPRMNDLESPHLFAARVMLGFVSGITHETPLPGAPAQRFGEALIGVKGDTIAARSDRSKGFTFESSLLARIAFILPIANSTKANSLRKNGTYWGDVTLALADALEKYSRREAVQPIAQSIGKHLSSGEASKETAKTFDTLVSHNAEHVKPPKAVDGFMSPVSRSPRPVARNDLPRDNPRFVARRPDLDEISASGEVVVVTGPPGVGKSSVALRWAHEHSVDYPDGQLFLDLQGFGQGEALESMTALERLLDRLGLPREEQPPALEERAALWKAATANRRLLIVLDNASSSEQVEVLLPASGSAALITSRRRLAALAHRAGAKHVRLDVLSAGESLELLRGHLGSKVDEQIADSRRLVALCGHLPIALTVVGGTLADRPAVVIRDAVRELRALGGAAEQPVDDGGRLTISHVFAWSTDRLTLEQRQIYFGMASAPFIDFPIDLLERWLPSGAGLRLPERLNPRLSLALVQQLVDQSLLVETTRSEVAGDASRRFRFHDVLRQHARQRANEAIDEEVTARVSASAFVKIFREKTSVLLSTREPDETRGRPDYLSKSLRVRLDAPTPRQRKAVQSAQNWYKAEAANVTGVRDWAKNGDQHYLQTQIVAMMARFAIHAQQWVDAAHLGLEALEIANHRSNARDIGNARDILRTVRAGIEVEYGLAPDFYVLAEILGMIEDAMPKQRGENTYRSFQPLDSWLRSGVFRYYIFARRSISWMNECMAEFESGQEIRQSVMQRYAPSGRDDLDPNEVHGILVFELALQYAQIGEIEEAQMMLEKYCDLWESNVLNDEFHVRRYPQALALLAACYLRDPDMVLRAIFVLGRAQELHEKRGSLQRAEALSRSIDALKLQLRQRVFKASSDDRLNEAGLWDIADNDD